MIINNCRLKLTKSNAQGHYYLTWIYYGPDIYRRPVVCLDTFHGVVNFLLSGDCAIQITRCQRMCAAYACASSQYSVSGLPQNLGGHRPGQS